MLAIPFYGHAQAAPIKEEKGAPQEAWLGVFVKPVPKALRAQLQLGKAIGLMVEDVVKDSPAASVGLQPYDVILAMGDQKLFNSDQLRALVESEEPGAAVILKIVRGGETLDLSAKLGSRDVKPTVRERLYDLDLEEQVRRIFESVTDNPEIRSVLSDAGGELAELKRSIYESLPTEGELRENISTALEAMMENGSILKELEILQDGDKVEIEIEAQPQAMRRSRILSDATEVNYADKHGEIKVSSTAEAKRVRIIDENEKIIYEGPLTEEAVEKLKSRDRDRLESLLSMHKIEVPEEE